MPHLIDRSIAPADPLIRIRISPFRSRVVEPRRELEDGPFRDERGDIVRVDVVVVPVEVVVGDGAQHLLRAVGQNRLHAHALAAEVQVRLEVLDAPVLPHHVEVLGDDDRVRRDLEIAVAALDAAETGQHLPVLWLLPLRVEVEAELHGVGDRFADRVIVDVPDDARTGLDQLAAVRPHDLALLADRPFHQQPGTDVGCGAERQRIGLLLQKTRERVMGDLAAGDRRRPDLDAANPAIFGEASRNLRLPPVILRKRRHGVRRRLDDQVGRAAEQLAEVPHVVAGESLAGGISFGSPFGAPASIQRTTVSSSASVSDRSFLNFWIPTVRSMCHGGIWRPVTRPLIERTHGRTSS